MYGYVPYNFVDRIMRISPIDGLLSSAQLHLNRIALRLHEGFYFMYICTHAVLYHYINTYFINKYKGTLLTSANPIWECKKKKKKL